MSRCQVILLAFLSFTYVSSIRFVEVVGYEDAWKYALAVHCVAWTLQFIGHGVFERRKPALLDNVLQVFAAPIFVTLEVREKKRAERERLQ